MGVLIIHLVMVYRLCYVVMPIYISEMSLKQHRGKLLSVVGQSFQIGLLVSVSLNIFLAKFCQGWRIAFVPVGVMGLVYTIGMAFMPHSPRHVDTATYKIFNTLTLF